MNPIDQIKKLADDLITVPTSDDVLTSIDWSKVPDVTDEEGLIDEESGEQTIKLDLDLDSSIDIPDAEENEPLYDKYMDVLESRETQQKIIDKLKSMFPTKESILEFRGNIQHSGNFKDYWYRIDWPNIEVEILSMDEDYAEDGKHYMRYVVQVSVEAEGGFRWNSVL